MKKKFIEWQKLKELSYREDENTAEKLADQMTALAKEILTDNEFLVFYGLTHQNKSFRQMSKELNVTEGRISQLWAIARMKVDEGWRQIHA